jgi:glycerol kinase
MLDNIPEVKKAHDDKNMLFGTVDSWLLYVRCSCFLCPAKDSAHSTRLQNLTGRKVHYTDASNASRTMFMDLRKQTWDPKLCDFFGIDMDILPEIKSSSEVYGTVAEGTLQGVEIAGLIGDQVSAVWA